MKSDQKNTLYQRVSKVSRSVRPRSGRLNQILITTFSDKRLFLAGPRQYRDLYAESCREDDTGAALTKNDTLTVGPGMAKT